MKTLEISGNSLTTEDIYEFVRTPDAKVALNPNAVSEAEKAHEFLMGRIDKEIIYGTNTGLGPMSSYVIGRAQMDELQVNLVRSHAVGMGKCLPTEFVLASMLVRLNTLAKGRSGVSVELLKRLERYVNERILPIVPEHGAVGTSGDLVQLAHVALALIGEGEVVYKGAVRKTEDVLRELKLGQHYVLKPKEGLALINGTSTMSGIAALLVVRAKHLLNQEIENSALALELIKAYTDGFSETLHNLRPHEGQKEVAKRLRELLRSAKLMRKREAVSLAYKVEDDVHQIPESVQEVYSFRCTPQILGPVLDAVNDAANVIEIEINSVTDNPIINRESGEFLHGGNFHGDYVAVAVDRLKIAIVKLSMLSERRINFFLNESVNKFLPPFLNLKKPGLTLALQGLQFVATSTTAQNQSYAFPHHIHSIPTNADNQDVVSMGTDVALIAHKVIENTYIVTAIERVTLCQAVDVLKNKDQLTESSKKLYERLRNILPRIDDDRVIAGELRKVVADLMNTA